MTNREKMIEELENGGDLAGCLMCPYIPGEGFCEKPDEASYQKQCRPCMIHWLDSEVSEDVGSDQREVVNQVISEEKKK